MNIESAYNKMLENRIITEANCWLYSSSEVKDKREIYVDGRNHLVARISAAINLNMRLYSHDLVCHRCKEENCWNPDHIYIGNTSSNTRDAINAGTFRNPNTGKTQCKNGHELTASNTYIYTDRKTGQKHRWCRACRSKHSKNYSEMRKVKL